MGIRERIKEIRERQAALWERIDEIIDENAPKMADSEDIVSLLTLLKQEITETIDLSLLLGDYLKKKGKRKNG